MHDWNITYWPFRCFQVDMENQDLGLLLLFMFQKRRWFSLAFFIRCQGICSLLLTGNNKVISFHALQIFPLKLGLHLNAIWRQIGSSRLLYIFQRSNNKSTSFFSNSQQPTLPWLLGIPSVAVVPFSKRWMLASIWAVKYLNDIPVTGDTATRGP